MRNIIIFAILCVSTLDADETSNATSSTGRILSRRKRYLIFPEGSSLQLVYCLTMPVIGKSTIFTIGGTAALAWELPHDPFEPYRKRAELLHRNDPPGEYIIKDPVKPQKQQPQKQQLQNQQLQKQQPIRLLEKPGSSEVIYNPVFVRPVVQRPIRFPTIRFSPSYNRYRYHNYHRQEYPYSTMGAEFGSTLLKTSGHRQQAPRQPVYYRPDVGRYIEPTSTPSTSSPSIYHQVHRRTRRDLYAKIEKFLSAQNKDGKACLLKAICEMHQRSGEKGSFIEEIMKAVFRVKPFDEHANEDVYDHAANKSHNCEELFAACDASVLHFI